MKKSSIYWYSKFSSLGIVLFVVLYLTATLLYPGGSNFDENANAFNWQHNYWCDLLGPVAKNGLPNSAQVIALLAVLILATAVCLSWIGIFVQLPFSKSQSQYFQLSGMLSMMIAIFIFTPLHDVVIVVAGTLAFVTLIALFVGLYKNRNTKLLYYGVGCLLLMGLNNLIYFTGTGLSALAILQKITFVLVLIWILLLNKEFSKLTKT
ncbi:MAG: hypothetical protein AAGG68_14080 [Bacteroidota bacterium]